MNHPAHTGDLKAFIESSQIQSSKNVLHRCLVAWLIVSASLALTACALESKQPMDTGPGTDGTTTLGAADLSGNTNKKALIAQIKKLEAQQLANNKLIEDLQNQIIENQVATQQALAIADAAQQMTAASDDRMEQLFQQSMFK